MLKPPIKNFSFEHSISQPFGYNADLYRKNYGIPNHNGIDIIKNDNKFGYGTPILAAHNGKVTKIGVENRWRSSGNGVYLLHENGGFSTVYWHLSEVQVYPGQRLQTGDIIGLMGNTGFCFPSPTRDFPWLGTHLHFAKLNHRRNNRYGGFVDPLPDLYNGEKLSDRFRIKRDLFWHCDGDDVSMLQTILHMEGFGGDYEQYGYFGKKTNRDVCLFQKKHGISPVLGYVGRRTRTKINELYFSTT